MRSSSECSGQTALIAFSLFYAGMVLPARTIAQWSTDPSVNSAICNAAFHQFNQSSNQLRPTTVSDGSGGAIFTWQDFRNGNTDIYVQRVNAGGVIQWGFNGVPVCTTSAPQYNPTLAGDGNGGAIVTWDDSRAGASDVYAQRLNPAGVVQWAVNGVVICDTTRFQVYPSIVGDGIGGAIIAWVDSRRDTVYDIYAQRVSAGGLVRWTENGIPVSITAGAPIKFPAMAPDGGGGAIICWEDYRDVSGNSDLYAQRVDTNGVVHWTANGVAVCTAANDQGSGQDEFPVIISDGNGGAIMTWQDDRAASGGSDIYAQRVNANGAAMWTVDGVAVATGIQAQKSPTLTGDGNGGAIIAWYDLRGGGGGIADIYAQRVNSGGVVQWTADGVPVCEAANGQDYPAIAGDGSGGAIIAWEDSRGSNDDIYAQRINGSGAVQWAPNGVPISSAADHQDLPTILGDGNHGAIVAWEDRRTDATTATDIYAQQVNANGNLGVVLDVGDDPALIASFALDQNYPNPFNPETRIAFRIQYAGFVSLKVFDLLGREVATLVNEEKPAGTYEITLSAIGAGRPVVGPGNASNLASGVYFYRLASGDFVETKKLMVLK